MSSTGTFREIAIDSLHESKLNPRRYFDDTKLAELAESIGKSGMLTPILVRPNNEGYEIAAGHRRYRASKLAALQQIPCVVRELTDQEFLEILTIENLQREDLHPLDEAVGYEQLMAAPYKLKVDVVAAKVGKSEKYVYDRVKLLSLTNQAKQLFWDGLIDARHAILLARLTADEQARVIGTKDQEYHDGGLLVQDFRLFHSEERQDDTLHVKPVSVHELDKYIKEHIRYNLKKVDAFLFPETAEAVQAATTSKTKIIEITHEYLAHDDVRHAAESKVYGERAWKRADGSDGSKTCEHSVLGVIASGPGQGQAFQVCVRKDKCLVHWSKEIRAREKRANEREAGVEKGEPVKDKWAKERERQEAERERDRQAFERWKLAMPTIAEAVAARIQKMPTKASGWLAQLLVKDLRPWGETKKLVQANMPRGTSADDVVRYLAFFELIQEMQQSNAPKEFPKVAKFLGIDTKAILKAVAPEPVQTSAKKKEKAA